MRVFICSCGSFSVAIPISYVSSVILTQEDQDTAVKHDNKNNNTYISLPLIFNYPTVKIKHGIILKNSENDDGENLLKNRCILLTAEIICETEIPEEKISALPKILKITRFPFFINGIIFDCKKQLEQNSIGNANADMTLIINPFLLAENINKELSA